MPKHILVVFNPVAHSGKSKHDYELFLQFIREQKLTYTTYITEKSNNTANIESILNQEQFDAISVVGGDGTLNQTINAKSAHHIPIHPIPAGTGNDLVKMVYPDLPLTTVFEKILSNNFRKIDIWQCNDSYFINGFGSGFDGAVSHATHGKQYPLFPQLKYWLEILKLILGYRSKTLTINNETRKNFMLAAANGKVYGGGFKVAPEAAVDDSLLDIIEIAPVQVWKRFFYLPQIERGKHLQLSIINHYRTKEIHLTSPKLLRAHLDGEPLLAKEYTIRHAGQINVPI